MQITLEIPEGFSKAFPEDASRIAMEALAAKSYQRGLLSEEDVRRLLGLDGCWEARRVLQEYHVWPGTTVQDALDDLKTLEGLRPSVP